MVNKFGGNLSVWCDRDRKLTMGWCCVIYLIFIHFCFGMNARGWHLWTALSGFLWGPVEFGPMAGTSHSLERQRKEESGHIVLNSPSEWLWLGKDCIALPRVTAPMKQILFQDSRPGHGITIFHCQKLDVSQFLAGFRRLIHTCVHGPSLHSH